MRNILAEGQLPIALIDRSVFDLTSRQRTRHSLRNAILHNVIPVQVTDKTVTLHDPLVPGISRRTISLFRQAYDRLGSYSVVCQKAETK